MPWGRRRQLFNAKQAPGSPRVSTAVAPGGLERADLWGRGHELWKSQVSWGDQAVCLRSSPDTSGGSVTDNRELMAAFRR